MSDDNNDGDVEREKCVEKRQDKVETKEVRWSDSSPFRCAVAKNGCHLRFRNPSS
jgi:hypothetical protein